MAMEKWDPAKLDAEKKAKFDKYKKVMIGVIVIGLIYLVLRLFGVVG